MLRGFKLTDEAVRDGFSGGTVSVGNGIMFDVGTALSEHDGVICTDDDIFASVLGAYPALHEASPDEIPEGAEALPHPAMELAASAGGTASGPTAPWVSQTTDQTSPAPVVEHLPGEGEIAAEHADAGDDVGAELAAGEAVSGGWGTSTGSDESSDTDEHNE